MKRFSEQLNRKSKTVKLRAAEKRELRERVVSYMEYHPLPKQAQTKSVNKEKKLLTEEYKEVALPFKSIARWVAGFAVLVLIVVPFAAERSVPGDNLYAVKRFNEEVRGTLAFNTIQKVEWETERLNRRIAEARLLASEGRLTDEVEAEVAAAVRTHSENAQKNIEVLRAEDEDEATLASIALETNLAVQSASLHDQTEDKVNNETGATNTEVQPPSVLAAAVEETRVKATAANASSTIPAFGKVMAKVEQNTTRAYELRNSLNNSATAEQVAEVTRRLEDIERSIAEAIELRVDDDTTARTILVDSLQRTQKLIVFMTDIDVSQAVDIEEIVPLVLTGEEEETILNEQKAKLKEQIERINQTLVETEDIALAEKAEVILEEIATITATFETEIEFVSATEKLNTALDLTANVYDMLSITEEKVETTTPEIVETVEVTASSTEVIASSTNPREETETESETNEEIEDEEEEELETHTEDQDANQEDSVELTDDITPDTTSSTTDLSTDQVDTE